MQPLLNRIMLYVKDVQATCDFYERHFGFVSEHFSDDRVVELKSAKGGELQWLTRQPKASICGLAYARYDLYLID